MINRFNLVDEPWIPVVNHPRVSLKEVFSDPDLKALSGNAIQKLSLLKFFLAIAQRAFTPIDNDDWYDLEAKGLAKKCVDYLEKNRYLFWLYGNKPFLQKAELATLMTTDGKIVTPSPLDRDYCPDLPSDNDTILFESQVGYPLTDAEKAVFLLTLMNYSLGGKRVAKNIPPFTKGYTGKTNSAKGAPSIGNYEGYLNSHLLGESVIDTIWLNLLTKNQLEKYPQWKDDKLIPPWEEMPIGEDDPIARRLKHSYMSTLCAMSRFVLLHQDGITYVEGLQYHSHKEGWREPFMTYTPDGKILWCNPAKKPWRNLIALLTAAFQGSNSVFNCPQISLCLLRARKARKTIGIWSGGLKVRTTAGDMTVKQTDDFIDTEIFLMSKDLGDPWFVSLESEMNALDQLSKHLWSAANKYFEELGSKQNPVIEKKIMEMFWELCERHAQELVNVCDTQEMQSLRYTFFTYARQAYDSFCPNDSARQMSSWANHIPNISSYISYNQKEVQVAKQ